MRTGESISHRPELGLVVIPPGDPKVSVSFAVFDDSVPALRAFVLSRLGGAGAVERAPSGARCTRLVPVVVGLVPRPDNTYNPRAVSVTAPPVDGGSAHERHLGYAYDSFLHFQGADIHRLAEASPVPIGCHGWIELEPVDPEEAADRQEFDPDGDGAPGRDRPFTLAEQIAAGHWIGAVRLNLPDRDGLRALVDAFDPAGLPDARPEPESADAPPEPAPAPLPHDPEAERRVAAWARYRALPHDFAELRAVSRTVHGRESVLVVDRAGLTAGEFHLPDGPLTLLDERVRPEAVAALRRHGVRAPEAPDAGGFPDATVAVAVGSGGPGGRVWSLRVVMDAVARRDLPEAGTYDPGSGTLTVYADAYAEPMAALVRRHGAEPRSVVRRAPDADTREHNRRAGSPATQAGPLRSPARLTAGTLALVPARHRPWLNARTVSPGERPPATAGADDPYYVRELTAMFGALAAPRRTAPCRLCAAPALETATGLAYCFGCCRLAQRGVIRDNGTDGPWTDAVIHAVRRLAELEFSGPPSLAQLDRVTVTEPRLADEAMLCRFLVPRPFARLTTARPARPVRGWSDWLRLAGVLDGGVRQGRGTVSVASDGHLCRSLFERHVDDFFHHHRVPHEPEPHYPRHEELNTTGLRADWLLTDGTYVEALGLLGQETYAEKARRKAELARVSGIRLVTVTDRDLERLPEIFAEWIPSGFRRPAGRRPVGG
ncbi:hypothetical protein KV205_27210 [Streptomyces sp. SKN60]|uniref:hypothetical protein n=1 Tax=Streptomyces sp. SKN60 TaxID=2855506 RepID=UPI0022477ED6|nr:hypothetical protein [Streptomyces sp. SKN60]MCX2184192.1 hypothetical protein [Streptomyces sp. SKN60]